MNDDGRNGVKEALVEVANVCRLGAPEYPWAVAKLLADELQRFRAREPLVQALIAAVDTVDSDAVRYGFGAVMSATDNLRAFKLDCGSSASATTAPAANAAEPTHEQLLESLEKSRR
jgi:hypothetical protein